ncbi:DUF1501 domain-containing protein [Jeongeupia naejangsanensis]|uniref:DUF1501 domain-containing protein n=1 Tax=Jeongeupia naejangsanensis TaxID=613195 RepID=A0ABS2BMZ3_9NEIS|nr:DUF1501 domain-containing protein [Jeongeupia naejangsanensis]MBM3116997.1 DUF1501 domain-containing protein [Jeongeupia naejangsanensis]
MTDLVRRRLLQGLGAGLLAGGLPAQLWAAPAAAPRLLLVFLRGAYDATSVLVPYRSDDYYRLRPNIAIATPDTDNPAAALQLDDQWGLHPALQDSLYPLWQAGELAFVPFVGTDDTSRSHFETQDRIEAGLPDTASLASHSGFLGRLSRVLQTTPGIAFTAALPAVFAGGDRIPNLALRDAATAPFDPRQSGLLADLYRGHPLEDRVRAGLEMRQDVARMLAGDMQAASRGAVSSAAFEQQARRMATLMRDQYRLGFVDVGGWDTHVNQGGAQGQLAGLLGNLGRGLAAFRDELGTPAWRDTVVVVMSEFGRTFRENGNRGTDHGHGTVYWVMGGSVRGRQIAGRQIALSEATLFQNRDYPVLNEYRGVLGGVLKTHYRLNDRQLAAVFPGAAPLDLGLLDLKRL